MRLFTILLLHVASLVGIAAPIQRVSYPYTIFSPAVSLKDPPVCHHRWRYYGHLTFRLARLESCREWTVQQATTMYMDSANGEAEHYSRNSKAMVGKPWTA